MAGRSAICSICVTDRCDFRCVYCMSEHMQFLPRSEVLSFEEIDADRLGFRRARRAKIRLTGGEPLVRRDIMELVETPRLPISATGSTS